VIRKLAGFFVLGGLLYVLMPHEEPFERVLQVVIPEGTPASEEGALIRDAVFLEEGLASGWATTDPVIRDRLIQNVRFALGEEGSDDDLLEMALSMGMERTDPVIRARVIGRVVGALEAPELPTQGELQAYLESHSERFEVPAAIQFAHVFSSSNRNMVAELEAAEDWRTLGEPFVAIPRDGTMTVVAIDAALGPGIGESLEGAPVGEWYGPFESGLGLHYFRVSDVRPARLPALEEIRMPVEEAWRNDRRDATRKARVDALMSEWTVEVIR